MKTRLLCFVVMNLSMVHVFSQKPTVELRFTALQNTAYVQLDSIRVVNRTQPGDTVLHWTDTVLVIYWAGSPGYPASGNAFRMLPCYPNPASEESFLSLYVPGRDRVRMSVTDPSGRLLLRLEKVLEKGVHKFRLTSAGPVLCFFTASWRHMTLSSRIIHPGQTQGTAPSLTYLGCVNNTAQGKTGKDTLAFKFSPGDELLYLGYAGGLLSGIHDTPDGNQSYTFQFATNIPCVGASTVQYAGKVYNTIQVFSQCWLKENLDIGTMIPGLQNQTDNAVIEKYCYDDNPDSCDRYGGLYQWDEMMQYVTLQGTQGICPPGWRIPTDEDWKILEGATDSQFGIGDPEWDQTWSRGTDAGTNLKTTTAWLAGNGLDLFGFSGLPAGERFDNGTFTDAGEFSFWWSSTQEDDDFAWYRYIFSDPVTYRSSFSKKDGYSVRCLRD